MRFRKKKSVTSVSVRKQEQIAKQLEFYNIFQINILYLERWTSQTLRCQRLVQQISSRLG